MALHRLKLYEVYDEDAVTTDFDSYPELANYVDKQIKIQEPNGLFAPKKKKRTKPLITNKLRDQVQTRKSELKKTSKSSNSEPEKKSFWNKGK
ncbi:hypothetical protein ACFL18_01815 [Patescibacteria group bacterium]